jgi:hypothetical protein
MTGHCGKNVEVSTTFLKVVVKSWEWRHDDDHTTIRESIVVVGTTTMDMLLVV